MQTGQIEGPTARDLRVALAEAAERVRVYQLAAVVRVHPGRLGQILAGNVPVPAGLGERILTAIQALSGDGPEAV